MFKNFFNIQNFKKNKHSFSTNPLHELGPLYHSYHLLGCKNEQIPGIYEKNQRAKENIIASYIMLSIGKSKTTIDAPVTFAELFCADGYYAMLARHFGATSSVGIDNDKDGHSNQMPQIASVLNITNCSYICADINSINALEQYDIVANVGGLYHVPNPNEILDKSYDLAKKFLIIQTVVSLANNDGDYFEAPAPGWHWGCRYSKKSFENLILSKKWNIVDKHFNHLEGNERLEDKGSIYYLIEK